jgi:two-component system response regulator FixJ
MSDRANIALVSSNSKERAAISRALMQVGVHVEPFEDIDELALHWPSRGMIMIEDTNENLSELIADMTLSARWLPIVAFSEAVETTRIVDAISNGAVGYVRWPCEAEELLTTLNSAEEHGAARGSLKLREARARSRVGKLTNREREVLLGVADGLSNRLIGERLEISPRTVEIHRANMLTKMGANHTSEAIRVAVEASLVG